MKGKLKANSGVTIIEVLISAVVFMIGFSLLISLLNGTLIRISTEEINTADCLAEEVMTATVSVKDTSALDLTLVRSGRQYRVRRTTVVTDGLAKVSVMVSRDRTNKQLIHLYNEFLSPEE